VQFRGTGDHINAGPVASLANRSFTIEFWAKRNLQGRDDHVVGMGDSQQLRRYLHLVFLNNQGLRFGFFGDDLDTAPGLFLAGEWYHIACVYESSTRERRIYVNGVGVATNIAGGHFAANGSLFFGRTYAELGIGAGTFHGYLDEVRVWDHARTAAQTSANNWRQLAGTETGLMAYYRFDEGAGITTRNWLANADLPATFGGALWNPLEDTIPVPTPLTSPAITVTATSAQLRAVINPNQSTSSNSFQWGSGSTALSFDGIADKVVIPHDPALNAYPLTVTAWVKAAPGSGGAIVNKYVSSSFSGWQLALNGGRLYAWYFRDNANNVYVNANSALDAGSVDDGDWHHVAFTVDATGGRIFVDGQMRGLRAWTGTPLPTLTLKEVLIGEYSPLVAKAQIDDVTIWNASLSPTQVSNLMFNPVTPAHAQYASLLGYWNFDQGAGIVAADSSPGNRDGLLVGAPTWSTSARPTLTNSTPFTAVSGGNQGLNLDGVNDYVSIPARQWFGGDFTIESWVYARSYNNWSRIIDFGNGQASENVLLTVSSGGTGRVQLEVLRGGAGQRLLSDTPIPLNEWVHVAATLSGTTATLYLNGGLWGRGTIHQPNALFRFNNFIGESNWSADEFANAAFDDVRIWNTAVSTETIRQWKDRSDLAAHPQRSGLLGQWQFDEGFGTTALDSADPIGGAHGTLVNGPVRVGARAVQSPLTGLAPGTRHHFRAHAQSTNGAGLGRMDSFATLSPGGGTALEFDGIDDIVRAGGFVSTPSTVPITSEVTIEFWQKVTAAKNQNTFTLDPHVEGSVIHAHTPWSDGVVYWDFGTSATAGRLQYRPPANIIGTWQHFALVARSGAFMHIYRNGVLEASKSVSSTFTPGNYALQLGGGSGYNFEGQLDEFRVWNVARTDQQIAQNFNASLTGTESGLVAYYRMNEGAGSTLVDSSARAANGLLLNGTAWVGSTAPVNVPVANTLAASGVSEGSATLNGSVKGGDAASPSSYWFEYGQGVAPVPDSAENAVFFYNVGSPIGALFQVNFNAAPALVQSFTNINVFGQPFWPGGPLDYFAARYMGRLYVPTSGTYTFYLQSDDGSVLFIDGGQVLSYDGIHGAGEVGSSIYLQAGHHAFETRMFENEGGSALVVRWEGPGIPKEVIPPSAFLRHDPIYTARTSTQTLGINPGTVPVSAQITNLDANINYNFRLVAANANGTNFGVNQSFDVFHPGPLTALNFDGINDHVTITPGAATPANALSLEAWVFPQAAQCMTIVSRGRGDGSDDYILQVGYDGGRCDTMKVGFFAIGRWDSSSNAIPLNVWTHVAVTYDGSNKLFYINGQLDRTVPLVGSLARNSASEPIYIGRQGSVCNCNYFKGPMDEVRIWHAIRSPDEIAANFTRALLGTEPGLFAYYRFDVISGSTVLDSGPGGRHGVLVNGPSYVFSGARLFQPRVTTQPATPVLATTATLRGTVNPMGDSTIAYFEYGPSIAYGGRTTPQLLGNRTTTLSFSAPLVNLEPGTTYYYRMVAYNSTGTNFGLNHTFTTLVVGFGWPVSTKVTGGSSSSPRHALDSAGNTYVAGLFSGSASFKSTLVAEGGSGTNAFVGKLARGADWIWATNVAAAAGSWTKINAIVADASQNVYVAGQFSGTSTFGSSVLAATAETNFFVAKLSNTGAWLWARAVGGAGVDGANALAVGPSGNVYVAGQFSGTANFTVASLNSAGVDCFVAKIDPNGNWLWARGAGGTSTDAANALVTDTSENLYIAGEFGGAALFGTSSLTPAGGSDIFIAKLNADGVWLLARRAGSAGADLGSALAIDAANQLYLLGRFAGTADYNSALGNLNTGTTPNIFVAKLNTEANIVWYAQGGLGTPGSIAIDPLGRIYIAGDFTLQTSIGTNLLLSAGNTDVFLAQLDASSGAWNWAQKIGASGTELIGSLAVDNTGSVVISGSFQNTVQIGYVLLNSPNAQDIFIARLDVDRVYEHNNFIVGQPISVPAEAQNPARLDGGAYGQPSITILESLHPDSDSLNSFIWSLAENKMFAVRPVTAILKWPLTTQTTNTTRIATVVVRTLWPSQPQFHVADAPAELEPNVPAFPYRFANLAFTEINGAAVDAATKQFNAAEPGWSVLQFFNTGGVLPNPNTHPMVFEVVRTVHWNNPAHLDDSVPAVIGDTLARAGHNDRTGKSGYVYFARSFYDGVGDERAHDRSTRNGPIIPVNKDTAAADDDLVVIWYRNSGVTGIAWPDDPVRYLAAWPTNPDKLVIASGIGSGTLEAADFPTKRVYNQPDAALPGYNPNEEHAAFYGDVLYALRNDLNAIVGVSEPYTLLKHKRPGTETWTMKVFQVLAEDATFRFQYPGEAGKEIQPPRPLSLLTLCDASAAISGPWFEDYNGKIYARAAGTLNTGTNIVVRWFYPLQPGFFYDLNRDGVTDAPFSSCLPLLDRRVGGVVGTPINVTYNITWPTSVPTLQIGETLINAKFGLPAVRNFANAAIVFDQANPLDTNALNSLVRLFDPLSERTLILPMSFLLSPTIITANDRGREVFVDLPYSIRARLRYDRLNKRLSFAGMLDEDIRFGGPDNPLVLINVLSPRERDRIKDLSADTDFRKAIDELYDLTRNPNRLDVNRDGAPDKLLLIGLAYGFTTNLVTGAITTNIIHEPLGDLPKAITGGPGTGSGFVTVSENNDSRLGGLPVSLHVIRIDGGPFRGDIKVLYPDNVFDERLTLRHSADFGGEPQNLEFEWYYKPDEPNFDRTFLPSVLPNGSIDNANGWIRMASVPPGINGFNDITIGDASFSSLLTISDNWFVCRYRGYRINGQTNWSEWVGGIGGGQAQLAEGWVKRVVFGLNPFEARTKAFHEAETVTFASMLQQAGARYEGDIAFNPAADAINSIGLIQAYETVLRRARRLSIEGVPPVNFAPANNALLLAAGRIADFYMLLGNEAFADAADPTIGFRTDGTGYGTLAPSIFTFQNQLDSLLEEELCLLRGRDDRAATVRAAPAYNRLFWNFTKDQGEVAYAQSYNIDDQNSDGFINAEDARLLYPQAHGDAWGHYLTAVKAYYTLLRSPNFDWIPRSESLLLAGVPVQVDYLDERKFARAAAAKAKTGAEIVDLTYRASYVDDPAGQWQGYKDTDANRAWGLSEWGHRAGSGAYLDWVMANSLLPATDPNTNHAGLTKIDRTTVLEIGEIFAAYAAVQGELDEADAGLSPLGLAKNVVPFDIDPNLISSGRTHFEQVFERALTNMRNSVVVFNHANQLSQALRSLQDSVHDYSRNVDQQERDYKNRLIEIFGYPYAGDIGPGGAYPSGYSGPDLYHYMYVNAVDLNGQNAPPSTSFKGFFARFDGLTGDAGHYFNDDIDKQINPGLNTGNILEVPYPFSAADFGFVAPASWGQRRAPGQIQLALSDLVQSQARLKQALLNYDNLLKRIEDHIDLLEAREDLRDDEIRIRATRAGTVAGLRVVMKAASLTRRHIKEIVDSITDVVDAVVEGVPKSVGLSTDALAGVRGVIRHGKIISTKTLKVGAFVAEGVEEAAKAGIELTEELTARQIEDNNYSYETTQLLKQIEQLMREEGPLRVEALALSEKVSQNVGNYLAGVARGLRLLEERTTFRKITAGETQESRYQDMTFRIFRNDAIQKYRAQFDLTARYVFLAAVAYDFETQLLGGRSGSGREFLTDIIRQRSLGQVENGAPIAGRHGLADPLARLNQNFGVLKGQLGFNNPQTETGRFSLRSELFRLREASDGAWRATLQKSVVSDLWRVPEFRRYCRPFAPESAGPQPGIVIRFPTTVTFGLNYFGWPLGGGDNAYDPTVFATKVRSAGVWFTDYNGGGLSLTPRVYLVPAGADILRSPSGNDLEIREWRVVDQKLPVPFPIGFSSLNNPSFIPINDTLSDTFADIRRFSSFRAYHDGGFFDPSQAITDSRLIGRSVWNTDWMLIIPGGTFLADPDQGLDAFIDSISDIKIFFQTYSYSGN
jgi:hypothetical protein